MKKSILLVAGCLVLVGCDPNRQEEGTSSGYGEYKIEGCQYIQLTTYGVTHKGNCTNSIHPENWPKKYVDILQK